MTNAQKLRNIIKEEIRRQTLKEFTDNKKMVNKIIENWYRQNGSKIFDKLINSAHDYINKSMKSDYMDGEGMQHYEANELLIDFLHLKISGINNV